MRLAAFALLSFTPALWGFAAKDVPSWVEELSTRQLPAYSGKVPAAVLLNDQHVTLDAAGVITTVERHAIKILNQQGKRDAYVTVHYWKNRRDVKDLHAWIIAPNGFQKTFEKNSVMDLGAYNDAELYTDGRARMITAENPEIGAVFAYEYTVQEKALAAQDEFYFQTGLPSLQSRYTVTLPVGWSAKAVVFNLPGKQPDLQPMVDGSSYTWEMKDLPFRDAEEDSASTLPRLAVSFLPPAGTGSAAPAFASWSDVSRWQASLAQGQDEVTPEISAKVNQLTAGAKSDYEKLCAIGRYVQLIRYVAIEMNLQNGGGYIPHAAGTVLNKQYGDCKDKANLMRSMLKAAGLESYLVVIYAGDKTHVREQWPSPFQFNHMIVAVKVSDSVTAPTAISSPVGRVLIFDPTDDKTPLGDLPWYLQGSYALLLANDRGGLLRMPSTKPEANLYEVSIDATLAPNGKLAASVVNSKTGQPASAERHRHADQNPEEYKTGVQKFLNDNAKGAVISRITPEDHFEQNRFDLKVEFDSPTYGQSMQGSLLVFNPAVVEIPPSIAPIFPKDEKRLGPMVLRAALYRKTVRVKLPAGFTVDEAPSPAAFESAFGKFSLTFQPEAGMLTMTEELRTEAATLPAEQFDAVKKFFDNCHGADRQNAVLVKN
jgi:transglutaminase-like putative cysteine protease